MIINNPTALLFDFDGVLVESYTLHRDTWHRAYKNILGIEMPDYPREVTSGLSPKKIAQFLADEVRQSEKAESLLQEKYRLVLEEDVYPPLFDGVEPLFDTINDLHIPFAVVSNAKRSYVQMVCEHYNLPVTMLFGLEDFSKPKPDKEPYEKAAIHLGLAPDEFSGIYVFEDSMPGIISAQSAGMIPVGVLSKHTESEMQDAGVTQSINGVIDISISLS
ncbi:MAG: HAD family phosphatase [Fibrobacterales bacterium]